MPGHGWLRMQLISTPQHRALIVWQDIRVERAMLTSCCLRVQARQRRARLVSPQMTMRTWWRACRACVLGYLGILSPCPWRVDPRRRSALPALALSAGLNPPALRMLSTWTLGPSPASPGAPLW